jgi:hypothetical protein
MERVNPGVLGSIDESLQKDYPDPILWIRVKPLFLKNW